MNFLRTPTRLANLLVLGLTSLVVQSHARREFCEITTASGTLILIGASTTDLTISADSKESDTAFGMKTGVPKIVPVSKFTACTMNFSVSIQSVINGKVVDKADLMGLVKSWAKENPSASQTEAHNALSEAIRKELQRFYSTHRNEGIPPMNSSLVCMGYEFGAPVASTAEFRESVTNAGFEPVNNPGSWVLIPGMFVPLGESQVCNDLLSGSSPLLKKYREQDVVQKYRKRKSPADLQAFTTSDLIALSKTCLVATESNSGLTFDSGANLVGAPNRYAVISRKTGFRFLSDN